MTRLQMLQERLAEINRIANGDSQHQSDEGRLLSIARLSEPEPKKITLRRAKELLRPLGITVTSRPEAGEYRVNYANGNEATAVYETDIDAAVGTGRAMWKERENSKGLWNIVT